MKRFVVYLLLLSLCLVSCAQARPEKEQTNMPADSSDTAHVCTPKTKPVREATCEENGSEALTCTVCGNSQGSPHTTPALGHKYDENGRCARCDTPASEGLSFYESEDGTCVLSGIGTCKDGILHVPGFYNGKPVTRVNANAFENSTRLHTVIFSEGIESTGFGSFMSCSNLRKVVFPNTLKTVGAYSFYESSNLNSVSLGENVEVLSGFSFTDCVSLREIYLGKSLKRLDSNAFTDCPLTSVTLPETLEFIGQAAFMGTNLTSLFLPAATRELAAGALWGLPGTVEVQISEENPAYILRGNCVIQTTDSTLVFASGTPTIPTDSAVTKIGFYALQSLTASEITIPASITSIDASAFLGLDHLTKIHFEDPRGWRQREYNDDTDSLPVDLSDPEANAELMTSVFAPYLSKE